jgi:hypothetical protein
MSAAPVQPGDLRRRNLRVALAVVGFMLFLYVVSVTGVVLLN